MFCNRKVFPSRFDDRQAGRWEAYPFQDIEDSTFSIVKKSMFEKQKTQGRMFDVTSLRAEGWAVDALEGTGGVSNFLI